MPDDRGLRLRDSITGSGGSGSDRPERENVRIHLNIDKEAQETAAFRARERRRGEKMSAVAMLCIALFFLFWASLLFLVPYTEWNFSPAWVFQTVQQRFSQLYLFFYGKNSAFGPSFWQQLAVIVVGSALAATGAVFQGSFRNVLAGPSTMGVMSGGSLGFIIYLLLFTTSTTEAVHTTADLEAYSARSFAEIYGQQICILLGCLGAVLLVVTVATIAGRGRLSPSAMILSGTVFSAFVSNINMLVQYDMIANDPSDSRIEAIKDMNMGNFNKITNWLDFVLLAAPIIVCLVILLLIRGKLNLLSFGEEEALTMGMNVQLYRRIMIGVGTVLTAMVVAFCGHVGFLGFMVPLVSRKLSGPDMKTLLPVSILMGGIILTVVFDVAYVVGMTDYLNVFTSSIGSLYMVYTLIRMKKKGGKLSNVR